MNTHGRSLYWDIFKGIAILMIIFGHTGHDGGAFVYLFHLELFFFVTGFLYNEKKYGDQPYSFFAKRIEGAWPRYTIYSMFFALTHNFMVKHGLMAVGADTVYALPQLFTSLLQGMIFQTPELLAGPMWFVPVWIFGAALFGGTMWFARRIAVGASNGRRDEHRECAGHGEHPADMLGEGGAHGGHAQHGICVQDSVLLLCALLGMGIGYYFIGQNIRIGFGVELSFFVLPLFLEGYFLRKYAGDFATKMPWPLALVLLAVTFVILKLFVKNGIWFDLSARSVHGTWFFLGTVIGIIFTLMLTLLIEKLTCGFCDTSDASATGKKNLSVASVLQMDDTNRPKAGSALSLSFASNQCSQNTNHPKIGSLMLQKMRRGIGEALAYIGRHSFDVMAFHIFVFKLLDMLLRKLWFQDPGMNLTVYPSPLSSQYWVLYTLMSVAVSVFVGWGLDCVKRAIGDRKEP